MIAVIFEVTPVYGRRSTYLDLAAQLHARLDKIDGFLSIERFESLKLPGKILSLSFWRDEAAIATWRNGPQHRAAQQAGRNGTFADYRLRIACVIRDYGMTEREEAPEDSRAFHENRRLSTLYHGEPAQTTAFEEMKEISSNHFEGSLPTIQVS